LHLEAVQIEVQRRLALGADAFPQQSKKKPGTTFKAYAETWLQNHGHNVKPSTKQSYEQLLRVHVTPRFATRKLEDITRKDVKEFLSELSAGEHSRNTVRLIYSALREKGQPIHRMRVANRGKEDVAGCDVALVLGLQRCGFAGLTADGSPLLWLRNRYYDVYALELDLP
jgi:hypothetical protein